MDYSIETLDTFNSVTIEASATYGDLLVSLLLTALIALFVAKWLHAVIMRGK